MYFYMLWVEELWGLRYSQQRLSCMSRECFFLCSNFRFILLELRLIIVLTMHAIPSTPFLDLLFGEFLLCIFQSHDRWEGQGTEWQATGLQRQPVPSHYHPLYGSGAGIFRFLIDRFTIHQNQALSLDFLLIHIVKIGFFKDNSTLV